MWDHVMANYWNDLSEGLIINANVTKVIIEEGITSVGLTAFRFFDALTEISLPTSITTIGEYAFYQCSALKEITIPEGVTSIEHAAFQACDQLKEIGLPTSVTSIKLTAFSYCNALNDVYYSGNIEQWKSIDMPDQVRMQMKNVYLDDGSRILYMQCGDGCYGEYINGILTIRGTGEMWDFYEDKAPWSNLSVNEIIIEEGITYIGNWAFKGALNNGSAARSIVSKVIEIPDTVTAIGSGAFAYCTQLSEIQLSSGLTMIGAGAFEHCESLPVLEIPASVTEIGSRAFGNCIALKKAVITANINRLEENTFINCSNLAEVYLPGTLTVLADHVFRGCDKLQTVYFDGTADTWKKIQIENGTKADLFESNIVTIDGSKIENAIVLETEGFCGENVTWSYQKNVLTIKGTGSIMDYDYPDVPEWTVFDIQSIVVQEGVIGIGNYAFAELPGLLEISLPKGLAEIGYNAFEDCVGLKKISLSADVSYIKMDAFLGCDALQEITYDGTDDQWNGIMIDSGNDALFAADISCKTTNIPDGFAKTDGKWLYYKNNTFQSGVTSVIQGSVEGKTGWWYVKNGEVILSYYGVGSNSNGTWYILNGKVDFSKNGVLQAGSGWYYFKGGKVEKITSVEQNSNGWWYIKDGKVDFGYTGIASNQNGTWYILNGKVDFSKNGEVTFGGIRYKIINGSAKKV